MNKIKLFAKILICSVAALPILCFVGCKGGYETKECIINEDFDNITLQYKAKRTVFSPSPFGVLGTVRFLYSADFIGLSVPNESYNSRLREQLTP